MTADQQARSASPDTMGRTEFVETLVELRSLSGKSYRSIAREIGSHPTTVHGWINGRHLPYPRENDAFCDMLMQLGVEDTEPWLRALIRLRATSTTAEQNPYVGLRPYMADDARLFFGRSGDQEAFHEVFTEFIRQRPCHPLAIIGPSGVGKSSFANVTVADAARRHGLNAALLDATNAPTLDVVSQIANYGPGDADDGDLVVIDQFEQVLDGDGAALIADLNRLCDAGTPVVLVVRSDFFEECLNHTVLANALQHASFPIGPIPLDRIAEVVTGPAAVLERDVEPQLVADITADFMEAGDDRHLAGSLPLLSFLLYQVADEGLPTLDSATYRALGRLPGAIDRRADQVYLNLSEDAQAAARRLFLRLANVTRNGPPTRRIATLEDDSPYGHTADDEAINAYIRAGLVTANEDGLVVAHEAVFGNWRRCEQWIRSERHRFADLAALQTQAESWTTAGQPEDGLIRGSQLAAAEELLSSPLAAERLTAETTAFVAASQVAADATLHAERRRSRSLRALSVVAVVAAVLALGMALVSQRNATRASASADQAVSRELSLLSDRLSPDHPVLAGQIALAAAATDETLEARSAIIGLGARVPTGRLLSSPTTVALAVTKDGQRVAFGDPSAGTVRIADQLNGTWVETAEITIDEEAYALAFDPTGEFLATGGTSLALRAWDLRGDAPAELDIPVTVQFELPIQSIFFGSNRLVAAGTGPEVAVLEVDDAEFEHIEGLDFEGTTWSVAASADGQRYVTGHDEGQVNVWSGEDHSLIAELSFSPAVAVTAVDFAPDGQLIAVGGRAASFGVWDISDLSNPVDVTPADQGFTTWVNSVAFDQDGAVLAAGSSDGTIRTWDTEDWGIHGSPLVTPGIVVENVWATPDLLVASVATGAVYFYDVGDARFGNVRRGVWSLEPDRYGRQLATSSTRIGLVSRRGDPTDGVDLTAPDNDTDNDWPSNGASDLDIGSGTLFSDGDDTADATWTYPTPADFPLSSEGTISPTGDVAYLGGGDGRIGRLLLGDQSGEAVIDQEYVGLSSAVQQVVVSPDGDYLAGVSENPQVAIWRTDQPNQPIYRSSVAGLALAADFSSDGSLLAVGSSNQDLTLYGLSTGDVNVLSNVAVADSDTFAVEFHPSLPIIATASDDGLVRLYDVSDPTTPELVGSPLDGAFGRLYDLSFSPTGDYLVGASNSAVIWDVSTMSRPTIWARLTNDADIYSVSFSPMGRYLLGGDGTGRTWIWDLNVEEVSRRLCDQSVTPLSNDEWTRYVSADLEYRPPCDDQAES